jgi:peptidoglycan/LPS O-acetylase OafA/YrhL
VDLLMRFTPQFATLFAVGVAAAGIVAAGERVRRLPWPWLALLAALPVPLLIVTRGSAWTVNHYYWVDLALGPAIACLLLGVAAGRPAPLVRLLDTRPIRTLGLSSYSLYLLHEPIVIVVYRRVVLPRYHHGATAFLVALALVLPLSIVVAWLFARLFERPFLSKPESGQRQVEQVVAPARLRLEVADVRGGDVHPGPQL